MSLDHCLCMADPASFLAIKLNSLKLCCPLRSLCLFSHGNEER